ncbi:MAG: class II fumarate hydratase [Archangium gephyra]|uniref:Fumarate hydratase class II n=1 Tax=Archangium gephyra TaxID=48 RepID=A0A2W5TZN0_9BACT|nr:MAG: class II fumarate hydratase [Archangium gephyra]
MKTRQEKDSFGPIDVPADRLWGAQTQRSLQFFHVSTEKMPRELIAALVTVKKAAALVNVDLAKLDAKKADAIAKAADEVLQGQHLDEFPLSVWQTGSGTQSNMNVNEVLANRASELLGGERGMKRLVHPNDDVNRSQSSNDAFPTAMHLAALGAIVRNVIPAARALADATRKKSSQFEGVVKLGRTHLQDATPITLGQEFSGWAAQLDHAVKHLEAALPHLEELALGGTAVGTGLNAPKGYDVAVAAKLRELSGLNVRTAGNKFEALGSCDGLVAAHAALKGLAVSLFKFASDVRLLGSGPRAGLGELTLPENEPGSSIMPGKVNPTQAEMMTMAATQVLANDVAVSMGGTQGHLQLNVFRPLVVHNLLQSCRLLAEGMDSFQKHCVEGLEANRQRIAMHLEQSLMLVTALAPHIGYEKAAAIAHDAHHHGTTLKAAAVKSGHVSDEQFDQWVRAEEMLAPR